MSSSPSSESYMEDEERQYFIEKDGEPPRKQARPLAIIILTAINAFFFIMSVTLFGSWFYHTHIQLNSRLRLASTYSPIHDRFNLKSHPEYINGTLFPRKHDPSIARQMPNDAADATWQEWELTRVVPVSSAEIRAMGKDPSTAAKLEDSDWGLGDDAYAAILDVYHHMHCLNMLRQVNYADYYDLHGMHMKKIPGMWDIHVNHCVDILMQALQCTGNVNLITMHWVETQAFPYPDMSVRRQCVDFDGLTDWRRENSIDMDKYVEVMNSTGRGDLNRLRAPDEYYKYYEPNMTNPNHKDGANPGEDFNL